MNFDVRDSLIAYRRFGFESSMPLLLAAFEAWDDERAGRLLNKLAAWSIRAVISGRLGGGQAEEAFCEAALAISKGTAKNQDQVREMITRIIPDDAEFRRTFLSYGSVSTTRAKYLLACIERQLVIANAGAAEVFPEWSSKSVTVEHISPRSSTRETFDTEKEYVRFQAARDSLQNLTLLERTLNRGLENRPFEEKRDTYGKSKFLMTRRLAELDSWSADASDSRGKELAELALKAWPNR